MECRVECRVEEVQVARQDLSDQIAEQIKQFTSGEAWQIIRWRISVEYTKQLQVKVNELLRGGDYAKAHATLEHMEGAEMALRITERLGDEIAKRKLDVDGALTVIENKKRGL